MKKHIRYLALITLSVILVCHSGYAIDLKETPIQSKLQAGLLLASSSEFDELNENDFSEKAEVQELSSSKKYSITRAALYSALLPGLGEFYVGHKTKARVFFVTEALSWLGYAAFHTYGQWKEDDMIRFASERAGADLEGKEDEFVDIVGFYDDVDDYNSLGRVSDRERPYLYDTPANHWRWNSEDDKSDFRLLKNSSRDAFRKAEFMIGAAVANRLISIIDAIRDAKRANNRFDDSFTERPKYKIQINPFSKTGQVKFTLFTSL